MKETKEPKKELIGRAAWVNSNCFDLDETSPFRDAMFTGVIVGYECGTDRNGKERVKYTLRNERGCERTVEEKRLFFSEEDAFQALSGRLFDEIIAAAKYLGKECEFHGKKILSFDVKKKRFLSKHDLIALLDK